MFHCQFYEGDFPSCFAFRFTILIKIIFIVIVGGIAISAEAKMVRNDCPFSVI